MLFQIHQEITTVRVAATDTIFEIYSVQSNNNQDPSAENNSKPHNPQSVSELV